MKAKRTLRVVATTAVLLASTVSVGAVLFNERGVAVLTEIALDPLAAFGQRSPGQRRPGALFQTKPSKAAAQELAAPRKLAAPQELAGAPPELAPAPPVAQAVVDSLCERLTTPVSAAVSGPVSPEAERLAGQLVAAVQQALAANTTTGQAQREAAVEQAIQDVLENNGATPQVATPALALVQARLVALGLNCAPGVSQAMEVASTAATQAAQPGDQPGATSQPGGPGVIGFPPAIGNGGGGGGGTTYRAAPNAVGRS